VENPATGRPVTLVQGGGTAEVDKAVRTAHAAHLSWKRRPTRERVRYLYRIERVTMTVASMTVVSLLDVRRKILERMLCSRTYPPTL
jgi:delta 1-pyrroline-5-carboxylate dehydrogenase